FQSLVADHPNDPEYRTAVARNRVARGLLLGNLRRQAEAVDDFSAALAALGPLAGRPAGTPRFLLRTASEERALALGRLGKYREALPDWDRAVEFAAPAERFSLRLGRARCLTSAGDYRQAMRAAEELAAAPGRRASEFYGLAR